MKKLVSVLFALLLVGSFAFADVAIGAWGRFIYSPAASIDGGDTFSFSAPSWANGGRVGFNVVGTSDNAGFKLNVDSNGNGIGVGDNAKIWIKLNDMVTIQGGKIQGDVLRGKIDDSGTLNAISLAQGTTGKDSVFQRFYPKLGLLLDITPAEGFYIGASLDTSVAKYTDEQIEEMMLAGDLSVEDALALAEIVYDGKGTEAEPYLVGELSENTFKKVQFGAGYVIADVGHFRAQYVGNVDDSPKYMNVAFAYTAMEGLVVDAGAKLQLEADVAQHTFVVHTTYNKDALGVIGRVNLGFGEDAPDQDAMAMGGSVDLSYTVADPLAVGFEVSYQKRDDPYTLSILPYGKMGYGNGYAKAGFLYTMVDTGVVDYSAWALPIVLEYWF